MKPSPGQPVEPAALAAGGSTYSPRIFGIGADPGHHEHRNPRTSVATEAAGVTVDLPQIERAACAAAGAVHVEPRRVRYQRCADRR
jgi:hypothetical protein